MSQLHHYRARYEYASSPESAVHFWIAVVLVLCMTAVAIALLG
jgi:hypothetical protein